MMLRAAAVVILVILGLAAAPAWADCPQGQICPSAPQSPLASDGVDGPGFIRTGPGGGAGYVDVTGYASCRYIQSHINEVIPVGALATWQGYLATGAAAAGDSDQVCCRPQTVQKSDFCKSLGGNASSLSMSQLPYTISGNGITVTAQCSGVNSLGVPVNYGDSKTYLCGVQGSGVTADGLWGGQPPSFSCSANYSIGTCSVSCGGGTQTIYDSCGNPTGTQSCNTQSCCTTSWSASYGPCSGSCGGGWGTQTVTMTDYGTCHTSSYSYQQACQNTGPCCQPSYSCGGCSSNGAPVTCTDVACGTGSVTGTCSCTTVASGGGMVTCDPNACGAWECGPSPDGSCASSWTGCFGDCTGASWLCGAAPSGNPDCIQYSGTPQTYCSGHYP